MHNEVRKDYILDRYVIIAAERAKRPSDFPMKSVESNERKNCSFCPGNEQLTPPADLIYQLAGKKIVKKEDFDDIRYKGWIIRCFPNLYPALSPKAKQFLLQDSRLYISRGAYGFHEIVVESANHDEHPHKAGLNQLKFMFDACLELLKDFYNKEAIEYVQIFRNHRKEAGASLSHAHTQIIAIPMLPHVIKEEFIGSNQYYDKEKKCIYCKILAEEKSGPRIIYESEKFVAITPWASVHPFEFWILPKRHESSLLNITEPEKVDFIKTLRISLGGLANILNDPPYNYGFHISSKPNTENKSYHWHLEVYPKLSIWAGFELSTGMHINVIPPEIAAKSLREPIEKELDSLSTEFYS